MTEPRILERAVKRLSRVRAKHGDPKSQTLHFTFPGAPKGVRHNVTFVSVENVPDFKGEDGWFEMEKVQHKPWAYWRAVCQVDGPPAIAHARPWWDKAGKPSPTSSGDH